MKSKTIVLIHGMYMTPLCWEKWIDTFDAKGFKSIAPPWPAHNGPVQALRQHPDPELGNLRLSHVIDFYSEFIRGLDQKPILIGHSMGGLVVQSLLQMDTAVAGVAIDSAPPMGVLSARWSFLKSNWPHINPFAPLSQPVEMTFERFQYTFANTLPLADQQYAFERYVVPESRRVPRESLTTRIDFRRPHAPLLLVAGSSDNLIPASLNKTNSRRYKDASSITDFKEFSGRAHLIIGQPGWEEVAAYILAWLGKKVLGENI
jgi:alpha-beta hydrolase superfamily lysophospholipase